MLGASIVPSDIEHLGAYSNHLRSYEFVVDAHPDWAAVMLFYCAVHQVERLLALEDIHSCEHADREFVIKSRYLSLWSNYRILKTESMKTRYLHGGAFSLSSNKVKTKLCDERLKLMIEDIEARIKARGIVPTLPNA